MPLPKWLFLKTLLVALCVSLIGCADEHKPERPVSRVGPAPSFALAWGSLGPGDNQFNQPIGVTADKDGFVYVADSLNDCIKKYKGDGTFAARWGTPGNYEDEFNEPRGVAVDSNGNVYVAEAGNHRVQKFTYPGR
jgi:DNA-binding beta-propeller fold protein YncE